MALSRQQEVADHPWAERGRVSARRPIRPIPSLSPISTPARYIESNIGQLPKQDQIAIVRLEQQLADEGFVIKSPDTTSLAASDRAQGVRTILCMTSLDEGKRESRVTLTFKQLEVRDRQWQMRIHDASKPNSRPETGSLEQIAVTLQRFLVQCRTKRQLLLDGLL